MIDDRARNPTEIQLGPNCSAHLYFPDPSHNPPQWANTIVPYSEKAASLRNTTHSAIVVAKVDSHVYAFTFGRAHHLLPRAKLIRNFGLRTVVNAVDPDSLHSIDMKNFEALAMHRRVQASSKSEIYQFGIDWTRDLLRAVTGTPRNTSFAKRMSGADSLVICGYQNLGDIPRICRTAMGYYESDEYKKTEWSYIDFLQAEQDPELVEHLDQALCSAVMNTNEPTPPNFSIDEIFDYTNITSYSIQPSKRHTTATLDLKCLRTFIRQREEKSPLEWLHLAKIVVRFADATIASNHYRVYNSLDWSTRYRDRLYVFSSGIWLRVEQEYSERLERCLSELKPPTVLLPKAHPDVMKADKGKSNDQKGEGLYIENATSKSQSLLKIHPKTLKSALMNEAVEPCDILGAHGALYYIKRGGESSGLSHLFSQGRAAALTLLLDASYRKLVREHITDVILNSEQGLALNETEEKYHALLPDEGFIPSRLEVCFIVIRNNTGDWPHDLPYLSKVSLYEAWRRLREAKFDVKIQCVTPAAHMVTIDTENIN